MLLDRLFSGEQKTWESFVKNYSPTIWAAINKTFAKYNFPVRHEEIEDVYSSIFLSLLENNYHKLRQYDCSRLCSLNTFLTIIAARKTIDHIRKENSTGLVRTVRKGDTAYMLEEFPDERPDAIEFLTEKNKMNRYSHALGSLTESEKQIYGYIFEKELDPNEIATMLGVSVATIYLRKHRLVEKLKKTVKGMDGPYV